MAKGVRKVANMKDRLFTRVRYSLLIMSQSLSIIEFLLELMKVDYEAWFTC